MKLSVITRIALTYLAFMVSVSACDASGGRGGSGDADSDVDTDACDCPDLDGISAEDLAAAIGLCPGDDEFSAQILSSSADGDLGVGIYPYVGNNSCLQARHGCQMIALGTGPLEQENPNDAQDMGDDGADNDLDPLPPYQGLEETTGFTDPACDVTQLRLSLVAPPDAQGFSFDFVFASSEYDEWVGRGYNDTFYAILEYEEVNGGAPTNIAFDDNGNEIEVDSNYFENEQHPCSEAGSAWSPDTEEVSGSTGWLRTSWWVSPGAHFDLTFSIHDEGDCIYDSMVLVDDFAWLDSPPAGATVPIE